MTNVWCYYSIKLSFRILRGAIKQSIKLTTIISPEALSDPEETCQNRQHQNIITVAAGPNHSISYPSKSKQNVGICRKIEKTVSKLISKHLRGLVGGLLRFDLCFLPFPKCGKSQLYSACQDIVQGIAKFLRHCDLKLKK